MSTVYLFIINKFLSETYLKILYKFFNIKMCNILFLNLNMQICNMYMIGFVNKNIFSFSDKKKSNEIYILYVLL